MPNSFVVTPQNLMLISSGMDTVLRWDGFAPQAEPAGVLPPSTALTLSGSGVGAIVGTYTAYLRYIDQYNNVSNLSPISNEVVASGSTGTITDASATTPIVITSAAHGLSSGYIVKIGDLLFSTSANGTWVITVIDANRFSLNGSTGSVDDVAGGTWHSGASTIAYSTVEVPVEPKVRRRQILRNLDGEATTYYVDVDTTDLTSTSFSSTRTDDDLGNQEAQTIIDSSGADVVNIHTVPPNYKTDMVFAQDRLFFMGDLAYAEGNVAVTFGSTTVTGIATELTSAFAGRFLYIDGAISSYEIASVDPDAQTLTLVAAYADLTSTYSLYAIRSAPAERKTVYFSEPGLYESVPATNAFQVQEDGDDITGGMTMKSFLYVLQRRHVYRVTFGSDPNVDGAVFLANLRGCVNGRCCVVVNDSAYMLDEQGVHAFDGSGGDQSVSGDIQGLFRPESSAYYQINWAAQRFFHAALFPTQEVIRWFVCFSGDYQPRHALCYAYRMQRWFVEEFSQPISASCLGRLGPLAATWQARTDQVFMGSHARQVLGMWQGHLDGADPTGTVRGTVTSSGTFSLTDSSASFAGTTGIPVVIAAGRGKGQVRTVIAASGHTLTVGQPWAVQPDTTTIYQLGGIPWVFRTGVFTYAPGESQQVGAVDVQFVPCKGPADFSVQRFSDFSETPDLWGATILAEDHQGVGSQKDDPDLVFDLSKKNGWARCRLDGRNEGEADGQKFLQLKFFGTGGNETITILNIGIERVSGQ